VAKSSLAKPTSDAGKTIRRNLTPGRGRGNRFGSNSGLAALVIKKKILSHSAVVINKERKMGEGRNLNGMHAGD